MKERYKEKIGYLFKKNQYVKDASKTSSMYATEGVAFYCNVYEKSRRVEVPMSNTYRTVTETVIKTDSQLNFEEYDRIAFTATPRNDETQQDYNMIVAAISKPRNTKGSKYRSGDYLTWEIRIS